MQNPKPSLNQAQTLNFTTREIFKTKRNITIKLNGGRTERKEVIMIPTKSEEEGGVKKP